jgi:uncharacterized protein YrrD
MIRATELGGRAVVDMDAAEKLGSIDKVILDPDARRVAGFVVSRGASLFGNATHALVSASAVHAIGPDAITVRHAAEPPDAPALEALPHASDLIGRKVVSTSGRFLGVVDDVLISGADGRIVGYQLASSASLARFGSLVGRKHQRAPYLRADAELRAGRELIVAPEDAVVGWTDEETPAPATSTPLAAASGGTVGGFRHATSWFHRQATDPETRWDDAGR